MTRSYKELIKLPTFEERLKYLTLSGTVGEATFGGHRLLNQILYKTTRWQSVRRKVMIRDDGNDLAMPGYAISSTIYIHHINPISIEDLLEGRDSVFDLDNLVSVSFRTHQEIHYGGEHVSREYVERTPNDTCPWK